MGSIDDGYDGLWWKDDKIFTGDIQSYPVELFISVIEDEARSLKDSERDMCENAWNRIADGKNIPSGNPPPGPACSQIVEEVKIVAKMCMTKCIFYRNLESQK